MNTTGAILAGGKSTRMKFHKAFAEIQGQAVIQIIIDKFALLFEETIIISNQPELFRGFGLPVYCDIFPYQGPVAGIHAALEYAVFDPVFVLGCDMPFINMRMVEYMLQRLETHDAAAVEINSFLQPTAAFYHKQCLPAFQDCLEKEHLKLTRILREMNTVIIKEAELKPFGSMHEILFNVNDPQALNHAREIAGRLL